MKIVFDTNVIISAFITSGLSSRVLDVCIDHHELYISPWIMDEVLNKLKSKMKVPPDKLGIVENFIKNNFIIVSPQGYLPKVCRDNDDNNILHLSGFIKADLLITGYKDLLTIGKHLQAKIITPRQFIEWNSKLMK
jgi:uncharacterized protein